MAKGNLRKAQRFERKAERKVAKAGRIEERAAKVREAHTRSPTAKVRPGEVRRPAERRATRMEEHAGRLRTRAQEFQDRSTARAPNLTPGSGGEPVIPDESGYNPTPPGPPWATPPNPRMPYAGGATIQQTATPGVESTISPYYVGAGPTGQRYEDWLNTEYGSIEDRTTNRFADMFGKYVDVANREANRQAGQIGESLGSRGALYSSANLGQQADLRQRVSQDIANTAAQYQTALEGQRQNAWQNVMSGQAGLATAEMGGREAAMGRAWQDFLRQSDVPPIYSQGAEWASTRPSTGYRVQW